MLVCLSNFASLCNFPTFQTDQHVQEKQKYESADVRRFCENYSIVQLIKDISLYGPPCLGYILSRIFSLPVNHDPYILSCLHPWAAQPQFFRGSNKLENESILPLPPLDNWSVKLFWIIPYRFISLTNFFYFFHRTLLTVSKWVLLIGKNAILFNTYIQIFYLFSKYSFSFIFFWYKIGYNSINVNLIIFFYIYQC